MNHLPLLGGIAGTKAISLAHLAVAFMFTVTMHTITLADEPFRSLEQEVVAILSESYADAELSTDNQLEAVRSFAANPRHFVIYRLNKIGDWQQPFDVQAPDRGGISVRFSVNEGNWRGALVVPYNGTTDFHVFRETHVVKNSSDGAWHIWAEILTPRVDPPEEAKNKLISLFNDFEKYQYTEPSR